MSRYQTSDPSKASAKEMRSESKNKVVKSLLIRHWLVACCAHSEGEP
jgi:hypothetical protein